MSKEPEVRALSRIEVVPQEIPGFGASWAVKLDGERVGLAATRAEAIDFAREKARTARAAGASATLIAFDAGGDIILCEDFAREAGTRFIDRRRAQVSMTR